MSQLRPPPPPSPSSISRIFTGSPKDGDERLARGKDGSSHLEYFSSGSWRHDRKRCRVRINPVCKRK